MTQKKKRQRKQVAKIYVFLIDPRPLPSEFRNANCACKQKYIIYVHYRIFFLIKITYNRVIRQILGILIYKKIGFELFFTLKLKYMEKLFSESIFELNSRKK